MVSKIISFSSLSDWRLLNSISINDSDVFSTDAQLRHPVICSGELWNFLARSEILSTCQSVLDNEFLVDRLAKIPAAAENTSISLSGSRHCLKTDHWQALSCDNYNNGSKLIKIEHLQCLINNNKSGLRRTTANILFKTSGFKYAPKGHRLSWNVIVKMPQFCLHAQVY